MKNIAVIFAGGYGARMQNPSTPKQFLDADGKPVIIYTLEIFEHHPMIDAICIACIEPWIPYLQDLVKKYGIKKVVSIVPGGETGQDSIYNGLCAARDCALVVDLVLYQPQTRDYFSAEHCAVLSSMGKFNAYGRPIILNTEGVIGLESYED